MAKAGQLSRCPCSQSHDSVPSHQPLCVVTRCRAQLYEDEPGCWVDRVEPVEGTGGFRRAMIAFAVRVSQWPNSLYMDPNFPASDFLPLGELEVRFFRLLSRECLGGWLVYTDNPRPENRVVRRVGVSQSA